MNLLVHDRKLLIQWDKIRNLLKNGFDSGPVYKYIKTKTNIYNNRVYTSFQYNRIPKDNEYCTCLSVILLFYSC